MDWRLEHWLYDLSLRHHALGSLFNAVEKVSIPLMVVLAALVWFRTRRGCVSAFAAAAVAFVVNFVIHHVHDRPRPYEAHSIRHPWSDSTDASFPSDHASVSFAIAFTVLAFDTVAGAVLLLAAVVIAVGRLFVGAHYPGDVLAGLLVGVAAAIVVVRVARSHRAT